MALSERARKVRDWLRSYQEIAECYNAEFAKYQTLLAESESAGVKSFSFIPGSKSATTDKTFEAVLRKEESVSRSEELATELRQTIHGVNAICARLKKSEYSAILKLRYIDGEPWRYIASRLYRVDESEVSDNHLRQCRKWHCAALESVADIVCQAEFADLRKEIEI